MKRKKWCFPPYFDSYLRERWAEMVAQGIATEQQAYTLGWMEFFVEAIFMLGCIDFPSDSAAILRVKAFIEVIMDAERGRWSSYEPSYLFEDGEAMTFAMGGLRYGAVDSPGKDVFSALLFTTERLFVFDSEEAPPEIRGILKKLESLDPDHITTVLQIPLQNMISISIRRPAPHFPHGSFAITFQTPDYIKTRGVQLLAAAEHRETEEQKKLIWKGRQQQFPDQMHYEIAVRSEDAGNQLRSLFSTLRGIGEHEGFPVSIE